MSINHFSDIRISVITVVRNGIEFIEETLASVTMQDYPNIEYIVIDGLSDDGTLNVIQKYSSKITYWISEKDSGIADAFNKGIKASTGQYLLLLNSDDKLVATNVIRKMVEFIINHNYPLLIYGDCNIISRASGEILYRDSIDITHKQILRGGMIPQPSLFTNREYFEMYGYFDATYKIAMDYEWLLRGVFRHNLTHVPYLITDVRNGGISSINRSLAVKEIIRALVKNGNISSGYSELKLRGYFFLRVVFKNTLKFLGVYQFVTSFRKRKIITD